MPTVQGMFSPEISAEAGARPPGVFFSDFSQHATSDVPSYLTGLSNSPAFSVIDESGNKILRVNDWTTDGTRCIYINTLANSQFVEVVLKARITPTGTVDGYASPEIAFGIHTSHANSPIDPPKYALTATNSTSPLMRLYEITTAGGYSDVSGTHSTLAHNWADWRWMRLAFTSDGWVRWKMWTGTAGDEPASWSLSTVYGTSRRVGAIGISQFFKNTYYDYDLIGVSTNASYPAPTS